MSPGEGAPPSVGCGPSSSVTAASAAAPEQLPKPQTPGLAQVVGWDKARKVLEVAPEQGPCTPNGLRLVTAHRGLPAGPAGESPSSVPVSPPCQEFPGNRSRMCVVKKARTCQLVTAREEQAKQNPARAEGRAGPLM
ncbi:hypothetical protein TREES_T100016316 [Tupaia chinensis]|uniref:Uncharacterized protein n=1 Tax=Tupaia chinensis TaxID=246437 RepID=L9JGY7_TUPCH|nr:hypothetical protein TREES_T100016316 [Tupaia chinensis]